MLTGTHREALAQPQSPTRGLGKNLYASFQAASHFQCVAFQERVLENTKVKIKYLIPLCERHENESHPD